MLGGEVEDRYVIQAVVKAMDVLLAFDRSPHAFSIVDLARATAMTHNQVLRCLHSLSACGVVQADSDGLYRLTPLLAGLTARAASHHPSLVEAARPEMDRLAKLTGETVNLYALADRFCVCVDYRLSRRDGVVLASRVGRQAPLHAGATPKAVLAYLPAEAQRRIIERLPWQPRYGPNTITDPAAMARELADIRGRGFAVSDDDFELGARGVGAPIFDASGLPVGGISLGGPISRVSVADLVNRFAPVVKDAASAISRRLGHRGTGGATASGMSAGAGDALAAAAGEPWYAAAAEQAAAADRDASGPLR